MLCLLCSGAASWAAKKDGGNHVVKLRDTTLMEDIFAPIMENISRWWQLKHFLFASLFGEDEPILTNIFSDGLVQPPTRYHSS